MKNYKLYQNSILIEKYSKVGNVDFPKANKHFSALKEFLKLSAITDKPCFPSKDIDEIWHTFILFTKDYQYFCINVLGKFVHHVPFINEEDKNEKFQPGYFCYMENDHFKKKYVKTLSSLEKAYKTSCSSENGSGGDCSTACSSCKD